MFLVYVSDRPSSSGPKRTTILIMIILFHAKVYCRNLKLIKKETENLPQNRRVNSTLIT